MEELEVGKMDWYRLLGRRWTAVDIEPSNAVGLSEERSQENANQEWRVRWWVENPIDKIVWVMAGLTYRQGKLR